MKDLSQLVLNQAQQTSSGELLNLVNVPKLPSFTEDGNSLVYEKCEFYSVRFILSTIDSPDDSSDRVYAVDYKRASLGMQERVCRMKLLAACVSGRVRGGVEGLDRTGMRTPETLQELLSHCESCRDRLALSPFTLFLLKLVSCLSTICKDLSICKSSVCFDLRLTDDRLTAVLEESTKTIGVTDLLVVELKTVVAFANNQTAIRELLLSIGKNGPRMTAGKYDSSAIETKSIEEALLIANALPEKSRYLEALIIHADLYRKLRKAVLAGRWEDGDSESEGGGRGVSVDSDEHGDQLGSVKTYLDLIALSTSKLVAVVENSSS